MAAYMVADKASESDEEPLYLVKCDVCFGDSQGYYLSRARLLPKKFAERVRDEHDALAHPRSPAIESASKTG